MLHRCIDAGAVLRGEQIEQEAAGHGETESGEGARILVRDPHRLTELGRRTEPRLDDAVEELARGRPTVERLAVDLEEEPLEGPERRVGDVSPPRPRRVLERQRRIEHHVADGRELPALDLADDGHPQSVLRAEVMAEHAVAGAQFRRQPPQREIREAVLRDVVDRAVEQLLSGFAVRHEKVYHSAQTRCTIWYMLKPVIVSVTVPQDPEHVFDFLDLMANHEPFNDHLMRDWELSGPERGVGSKARVHTRALGMSDVVDIEVIDAEAPIRIVERNVAAKAGRTGEGTYTLEPLPDGGTRITFEYRWIVAPMIDRLTAPLARAYIRRNNETAMRRLAAQLAERDSSERA